MVWNIACNPNGKRLTGWDDTARDRADRSRSRGGSPRPHQQRRNAFARRSSLGGEKRKGEWTPSFTPRKLKPSLIACIPFCVPRIARIAVSQHQDDLGVKAKSADSALCDGCAYRKIERSIQGDNGDAHRAHHFAVVVGASKRRACRGHWQDPLCRFRRVRLALANWPNSTNPNARAETDGLWSSCGRRQRPAPT